MKPYLNVLGRKHNIVSVEIENETGQRRSIYDSETFGFMDENQKADLATAIENPSKYQKFLERIEKTMDESVEYLTDLKLQLADNVVANHELPFPEAELKPIVEEIKSQVVFIEALELALTELKSEVDSEVPSTE